MTTHFQLYPSSRAILFAGLLLAIAPASALSQSVVTPEPIEITLTQTAMTGRQSDGDLTHVRPGDQVEYRAAYANTSLAPVVVVATLPIPQHMVYQPKSAYATSGVVPMAATTDAHYALEPLQRWTIDIKGQSIQVPVPFSEYRTIRWNLGAVPAGQTVTVRLRANVAYPDRVQIDSNTPHR